MCKKSLIFILSILSVLNINAQIQVEWTALVGVDYDTLTSGLTKTATDGWNNAGARSINRLDANEDGKVSYIIDNLNTDKAIGLSTKNNNQKIKSLDYAIVFNGDKLAIYESGKFRGNYGKIKLGDELSIEREGNKIIFRKNGKQFRKRPTNPDHSLYADVSIYHQGASISDLTVSFYKPLKISYTKQDVNCEVETSGEIDITIDGGKLPYSFLWSIGDTTEDISNLDIGKYSIIVTDDNGKQKNKNINILSSVIWTDLEGVTENNNNLIKYESKEFIYGAAASLNKLLPNEDGKLVYEIEDSNYSRVIGLTHENILGDSYFKTNYALFIAKSGKIGIIEGGVVIGQFGEYKQGDIVKIKRQGNEIIYKKNNAVLRKVLTDPTLSLIVDISLAETGATLTNVKTDFCNLPFSAQYTVTNETPNALGSVTITPIRGTPPYYYFWDDGYQSGFRHDLESGIYNVTIVDTLLDSVQIQIPVGMEILLDSSTLVGLTFANDELTKNSTESWGNGKVTLLNEVFKSTLDGEVLVKITEVNKEWTYGFRKEFNPPANNYQGISYGFYVDANNKLFTISEPGLTSYGKINVGDVLSVGRHNNTILFKKNGVILSTTALHEDPFKIDFSLYSNMKLGPITVVKFPHWPKYKATIIHNSCFERISGSITLINGVGPTITNIEWTGPNGYYATNVQSITGLVSGTYTLILTYANQVTITKTYDVGYKVEWTNLVASTANDNDLVRNTAITDEPSGASSVNILHSGENGWAQFTVNNNPDDHEIFGLSSIDVDATISTVQYGILLFQVTNAIPPFQTQLVTVLENGVDMGTSHPPTGNKYFTTYIPGDRFRVEKVGSTINYLKNGVVFYTSTISVPAATDLIVDAGMLLSNGNTILNAITSFKCISPCDIDFSIAGIEFSVNSITGGYSYQSSQQYCVNDVIPLTVVAPSGFNINNYIFSWSQVTPTTGTNYNCQNPNECSSMIFIPTTNQQHIFQVSLSTYNNEDISYCPFNQIVINVDPNCEPEPQNPQEIIGCIFGNFGAGVYVSPTTNLNVYCNVINELGGIQSNNVEKGEFLNYGDINVKLDWINNGQNGLFINNNSLLPYSGKSGIVDFFGDDQKLRGNSSTNFYDLELGESDYKVLYSSPVMFLPASAGGVKTMGLDQYAYNQLDLQNSELNANDQVMYIERADQTSSNKEDHPIYRGNGPHPTGGGTGFVSTDGMGYLSRQVDPGFTYFYPMGSKVVTARYRPVAIEDITSDHFKVNYQNHDPLGDGLTALSPSVLSINDKFYHRINNATGSSTQTKIQSYYTQNDGIFQSISHWNNNAPWWQITPGQNSSPVAGTNNFDNGLFYAESIGAQNFSGEPYVLSQGGFVIGTPNWPSNGGGGQVIISNPGGPGNSNGCIATFVVNNYNPQIVLTNTSTVSNNATYTWTLGDGNFGSGPVFTHSYAANGNYVIQLDITDGVNTCSSTANIIITGVGTGGNTGSPGGSSQGTSNGCIASFTSNNYDPQITLNNTSNLSSLVSPVLTWNFGDGNNSTGSVASNTYANNGTYTVTLTITDAGNPSILCTATNQITISNNSGIIIVVNPDPNGPNSPGGSGGNMGNPFGPGPGSGPGGNNTSNPNNIVGDYVMTITTNDNCRLDGEIYFNIQPNLSLGYIEYSTDGGVNRYPLSNEIYSETIGIPGFTLIATPADIIQSCINSTVVSMGIVPNNDFVITLNGSGNTAAEDIEISTPFIIQDFKTNVSGSMQSIGSIPTAVNNTTTLTTSGSLSVTPGVYQFQLDLIIGTGTETIKGQFIAKQ